MYEEQTGQLYTHRQRRVACDCPNCQNGQSSKEGAPYKYKKQHVCHYPKCGKVYAVAKGSPVLKSSSSESKVTISSAASSMGIPISSVVPPPHQFCRAIFGKTVHRFGGRLLQVVGGCRSIIVHSKLSDSFVTCSRRTIERAVQTFKENLKKSCGDLETRLSRFLFHYRTTPHTTTGVSPAELLLGRKPRTLLDNLHPDLSMNGSRSQEHQKIAHDKHSRHRLFQIGDTIYVKNCRNTPEWLPGVVSGFSELALLVKLLNGKICRCHIDHVRVRTDSDQQLLQEGSVVKCAEGGNAVCSELGSAITENGADLLSEDFVADLLVHSAPETRAVDPRVNNPNEAMQEVLYELKVNTCVFVQ
eukprot:Em0011g616a